MDNDRGEGDKGRYDKFMVSVRDMESVKWV